MGKLKLNLDHSSSKLDPGRFDDAINNALQENSEARLVYDKSSMTFTIARLVRKLRSKNKMTQAELAGKAGIPQSFISRIENPTASKSPSLETISKIVGVFGFKVSIAIEKSPYAKESGTINDKDGITRASPHA